MYPLPQCGRVKGGATFGSQVAPLAGKWGRFGLRRKGGFRSEGWCRVWLVFLSNAQHGKYYATGSASVWIFARRLARPPCIAQINHPSYSACLHAPAAGVGVLVVAMGLAGLCCGLLGWPAVLLGVGWVARPRARDDMADHRQPRGGHGKASEQRLMPKRPGGITQKAPVAREVGGGK